VRSPVEYSSANCLSTSSGMESCGSPRRLTAVRAQRLALAPDHATQSMVVVTSWSVSGRPSRRVRLAKWRIDPGLFCHLDHPLELASERRVIELLDAPRVAPLLVHRHQASRLDGEESRTVRLMDRVAVAAVAVICDYNMRSETADLRNDLPSRPSLGVGPSRTHPELIGWRACHSRVAVAKEFTHRP